MNLKIKSVIFALASSALFGCGPSDEEIRAGKIESISKALQKQIDVYRKPLADNLKDPDSVKYRNERIVRSSISNTSSEGKAQYKIDFCFEYDAKNSYGAFSGFESYFITAWVDPTKQSPDEGDVAMSEISFPAGAASISFAKLRALSSGRFEIKQCLGESITVKEFASMIVDKKI